MSVGDKPDIEPAATDFTVNGKPLDEYFHKRRLHRPVLRGELLQILGLYVDKKSFADAMEVLRHGMRDMVRKEVQAEMGAFMLNLRAEGESKSEGGIVLPPGVTE